MKGYFIGCIPLKAMDVPPPEQVNCKPLACPECKHLMWVSENKSKIMATKPKNTFMWCFDCIVKAYPKECKQTSPVDIANIKWGEI